MLARPPLRRQIVVVRTVRVLPHARLGHVGALYAMVHSVMPAWWRIACMETSLATVRATALTGRHTQGGCQVPDFCRILPMSGLKSPAVRSDGTSRTRPTIRGR